MTTAIRYSVLTNTTGALIADPAIQYGQDWATQGIAKTFIAAEIGTDAGKTRDTTSNPTKGFLLANFYGPPIQEVVDIQLIKTTAVTHDPNPPFRAFVTGTADHFVKIACRIDNSVKGVSSLYIIDQGDDAATQIANGDTIVVTVAIGTTP